VPRRVNALSTYVNAATKTYPLGLLPSNATWGRYDPYDNQSKDLCIPSTNERIHIWVLGHITSLWFMKNGTPDNQCSVTVLPLSNSLGIQANCLISGLSHPVFRTFGFSLHPLQPIHTLSMNTSISIFNSWCYPNCSMANS